MNLPLGDFTGAQEQLELSKDRVFAGMSSTGQIQVMNTGAQHVAGLYKAKRRRAYLADNNVLPVEHITLHIVLLAPCPAISLAWEDPNAGVLPGPVVYHIWKSIGDPETPETELATTTDLQYIDGTGVEDEWYTYYIVGEYNSQVMNGSTSNHSHFQNNQPT